MSLLTKLTSVYAGVSVQHSPTLNFFSDGGTRPYPAAASSAVVVKDERGQVRDWFSRVLPPLSSCEAEYYGLLDALELAGRLQPHRACFHLDSQIVVGQVTGVYAVREPKLKPLHAKALEAVHKLRERRNIQIKFYYVPREYNLLADALASDALLVMPHAKRQVLRKVNPSPVAKAGVPAGSSIPLNLPELEDS